MFKVKFETEGAAFCSPYDGEYDAYYAKDEVIRILKGIIRELEDTEGETTGRSVIDINGNKVGEWKFF